jgi:thiamine-monophosphate kinase
MELSFVDWLRSAVPAPEGVLLGIGDDAAVLAPFEGPTVVTSDLLIDGVHFLSATHSPERIGRKALAVNLSDLAAMGATPRAAVLSLALPKAGTAGCDPAELARRLVHGMLPLSERFACPLVGGDTNVGPGPLVVSVTALGEAPACGVARRDAARVGDAVFVTGALGGSIGGKHLDFTPRVSAARTLVERYGVRAMMDVTDGLAIDAHRMATASGVGIAIDADAVPLDPAARRRAATSGRSALEHALSDGEDFELLFTAPEGLAEQVRSAGSHDDGSGLFDCAITLIGRVVAEPGLWRIDASDLTPLEPRGYEHQ